MSQDLDQKTIDSIIDKKLALMEAEYEMFKKYDDPNYKGAAHPIDQEQKIEINNNEEENNQKDDENQEENPEEADEFQEYQGYEKMDDNSEKDEEEEINYDQIEHIDPFAKPLDVEFIKQCMAKIQLPTPAWAQNNEGWEQRIKQMKQP